jgi:predicted NBD/HSP70 family sugar kinase
MYLLFDIGGTKMRLAVSADGKTFSEPKICKTPTLNFNEGIRLFGELAKELSGGKKITASAGGIAGPLDRNRTKLVRSPNISGWVDKPLKDSLEQILDAGVFLENDTAIVGLGEATAGAATGFDIAVYITVSTGVGGVRIVQGKIDQSAMGFEIGHQIIDASNNSVDSACSQCGHVGELEGLVSGTALSRKYGKKPYEITDSVVWEETARLLAIGLNNTIVHWSPDVLVLGGSMIVGDPAIPLEAIQRYVRDTVTIFPELPDIKKAELGDVGGLHGALAFLHQNLS